MWTDIVSDAIYELGAIFLGAVRKRYGLLAAWIVGTLLVLVPILLVAGVVLYLLKA